jgi:hypothetical protein
MRHLLRLCAVLVAGLLTVSVLAAPANAARDDRAGRWLDRQLTGGLVHNDQFDFDDHGLTADFAFGLKAIGGQRPAVRKIRRALARDVNAWTTFSGDVFAGSVAKAVVLAQISNGNERSFGGVNLVKRLNKRVGKNGRIADKGASDFANTIGQAFAARGLANAGSTKAGKATRFLLKQQCSRGYFRLDFAPKGAKRQHCDAGNRTTSAPDTDVTALAVLQLSAIKGRSAKVRAAIDDANRWLLRKQKRNGSFGGGPTTKASNSNSTGLAGWALGSTGSCHAAAKAARWVRKLQVPRGVGGTPLAGEAGAVAYNRAALRDGQNTGIDDSERDQWRRATAQAGPGLTYLAVKKCRGR